jgi:hypothetical protein
MTTLIEAHHQRRQKMTNGPQFDYRNDRLRAELTDGIADCAWGAIKAWQAVDDRRPQLDLAAVRDATDEYLCGIATHPDCHRLAVEGVADVMLTLDRAAAAIYLQAN